MLKHAITLLILSALASAGTASAQASLNEQAIESSTSFLHLSNKLPQSLSIAPCPEGCATMQLRLTETSQFWSGKEQLGLGEFQRLASRAGLNTTIFFDASSKTITRIVIAK
jgi:hypothetical protein